MIPFGTWSGGRPSAQYYERYNILKWKIVIKDFLYNYDRINSSVVKERQQGKKKFFTLKVFEMMDATWHSEISDCVLSPQAYLH